MDDQLVQSTLPFRDEQTEDEYCCLKNFLAFQIMRIYGGSPDSITHVAHLAKGVGDGHLTALFMLLSGRHTSVKDYNLNGVGRILRLNEADMQMFRSINVHQRTRKGGQDAKLCGCKLASNIHLVS